MILQKLSRSYKPTVHKHAQPQGLFLLTVWHRKQLTVCTMIIQVRTQSLRK